MGVKGGTNLSDSPKIEVGEIDTSSPFASVKAAVSLFGEVAFSGDRFGRKPKPSTPEKAFATEARLHLAQKELNKYKEQLQTAETTQAQSLAELERAKKTVQDLIAKLTVINESKELALKFKDQESLNAVTTELDRAKEALQRVAGEESSIRGLVESLKSQLEAVTKRHGELKEKDAETETLVADLHVKLQNRKAELGHLTSELQQLKAESDSALREAEAMKKEAEELRVETGSKRSSLLETEKKLEVALKEAEAAKAAEAQAIEEIKNLSVQEITISKEYKSLSGKVAAAAAQVEAARAGEAGAGERLEGVRKEMEEVEKRREEVEKRAEMAEAARKAVEGELRRWSEKEQKRASEMAERLMAETEASPVLGAIPAAQGRSDGWKKLRKKTTLLSNLGGIFHRKKREVDGGLPSSHVRGGEEKHT